MGEIYLLIKTPKYYSFILKEMIPIDFSDLLEQNHMLAEFILNNPDQFYLAASNAIKSIPEAKSKFIRLYNLPKSATKKVRDLRFDDIGKMIQIEGIIKVVSTIRPQASSLRYACSNCMHEVTRMVHEGKITPPNKCSCGTKRFRQIGGTFYDAQRMAIEEPMDLIDGGNQPQRLNMLLTYDTANFELNMPGNRVLVVGSLEMINKKKEHESGASQDYDWIFKVNSIKSISGEVTHSNTLTPKDIEEIKTFCSVKNPIETLGSMIAPDIIGHDDIKQAILFQMAGGVKIKEGGKVKRVGDIHLLVVADPGVGKSRLGYETQKLAPKSRYVDGTGASGVGLTASIVKDEFLGGFAVEGGALVLAHEGLLAIDEFDKMNQDDRRAMHVAMTEQIVQKDKANVHVTMKAETAILALANPKHGRFGDCGSFIEQINLEPSLINRFDLIFALRDKPDEEKDQDIFSAIVSIRDGGEPFKVDKAFFRKYITYCRSIYPKMSDKAKNKLNNFYISMRQANVGDSTNIPITPRQADTLVKLAQASARLHLSEEVQERDATISINMMKEFLSKFTKDSETGLYDISYIDGSVPTSKRTKMQFVRDILSDACEELGVHALESSVWREKCHKLDLKDSEWDELVDRLRKSGDIFEPRREMFSPVK
jgi:replicative DNA helicase Mcm